MKGAGSWYTGLWTVDTKLRKSGKRFERKTEECYNTKAMNTSIDGRVINSDVNGSANIGRKVIKDEDVIFRLDRSVAATPVRVNPLKVACV